MGFFFNSGVCCVLYLESSHQGDSNENTGYTFFIVKKITLNCPSSAFLRFFLMVSAKCSVRPWYRDKLTISV